MNITTHSMDEGDDDEVVFLEEIVSSSSSSSLSNPVVEDDEETITFLQDKVNPSVWTPWTVSHRCTISPSAEEDAPSDEEREALTMRTSGSCTCSSQRERTVEFIPMQDLRPVDRIQEVERGDAAGISTIPNDLNFFMNPVDTPEKDEDLGAFVKDEWSPFPESDLQREQQHQCQHHEMFVWDEAKATVEQSKVLKVDSTSEGAAFSSLLESVELGKPFATVTRGTVATKKNGLSPPEIRRMRASTGFVANASINMQGMNGTKHPLGVVAGTTKPESGKSARRGFWSQDPLREFEDEKKIGHGAAQGKMELCSRMNESIPSTRNKPQPPSTDQERYDVRSTTALSHSVQLSAQNDAIDRHSDSEVAPPSVGNSHAFPRSAHPHLAVRPGSHGPVACTPNAFLSSPPKIQIRGCAPLDKGTGSRSRECTSSTVTKPLKDILECSKKQGSQNLQEGFRKRGFADDVADGSRTALEEGATVSPSSSVDDPFQETCSNGSLDTTTTVEERKGWDGVLNAIVSTRKAPLQGFSHDEPCETFGGGVSRSQPFAVVAKGAATVRPTRCKELSCNEDDKNTAAGNVPRKEDSWDETDDVCTARANAIVRRVQENAKKFASANPQETARKAEALGWKFSKVSDLVDRCCHETRTTTSDADSCSQEEEDGTIPVDNVNREASSRESNPYLDKELLASWRKGEAHSKFDTDTAHIKPSNDKPVHRATVEHVVEMCKERTRDGEVTEEMEAGPPLEDNPLYAKYFKMLKIGLPMGAVKNAMVRDGHDPTIMDGDFKKPAKKGAGGASNHKTKDNRRRTRLHWTATSTIQANSMWAMVDQDGDVQELQIDEKEFASLFETELTASTAGRTEIPKESSSDGRGAVKAIDAKRANNGGIILSQVKMTFQEMARSVDSMDDSALTVQQLCGLVEFVPTLEERGSLMKYLDDESNDFEKLCECEKFMVQMMAVDSCKEKMLAMLFKRQFPTAAEELRRDLSLVERACDEVTGSVRMRKFLGVILTVGNKLNTAGAGPESATRSDEKATDAIAVESLLKLDQVKAFDRKTTFLQYVTMVLRRNKKEDLLEFPNDMPSITSASVERVVWDVVVSELHRLKTQMNTISSLVSIDRSNDSTKEMIDSTTSLEAGTENVNSAPSTCIGRFAVEAADALKDLEKTADSVWKKYGSVADYFGLDEDDSVTSTRQMQPHELFHIIATFCQDVKRASSQV